MFNRLTLIMAKRIPIEKINLIKKLRSEGWSLPEIHKEVGLGYGSVFRYLKNVKISPQHISMWRGKWGGSIKRKVKLEAIAYKKAKKEVFDHYGRKCAWCGETNPAFLTIDHINNDGNRERLQYGSGGVFYLHVVRAGFPTNLQVLCFNCNCAKGFRGYAPSTFIGFQDGDGI